jgi:pimeloyl-ACP methyl ester carboxylesterase
VRHWRARACCTRASISNVAIVSAGVALFLRFAPLPLALKLIWVFGVLPLHEYGVVARSYGLSFALLTAACAALSAQRRRPLLIGGLLALLANTNVHSLILAAGLGLYWLLERAARPGAPLCPRISPAWRRRGRGCFVVLLPPTTSSSSASSASSGSCFACCAMPFRPSRLAVFSAPSLV